MAITRRTSVKKELGQTVVTVLSSSRKTIEMGFEMTTNLFEVARNETSNLVHDSRVSGLLDRLEASIEAMESLGDYGHSKKDIEVKCKALKDQYIKDVVALTGK